MNPAIKQSLTIGEVRSWFPRLLACGLLVASLAGWTADEHMAPDLTVHEWGTFTAIAGRDGRAAEWSPLGSPRVTASPDLPQFVEHFDGVNFKRGLRGTIRMETPVLYFYSPRDVTVSARVSFAKGLITEWYPHADRVLPGGAVPNAILSQLAADGSIAWNHVAVSPNLTGDFPGDAQSDRYYAARETASSPLRVQTSAGEQQEKFLFYRGVSASSLPISAKLASDGKLVVKSLTGDEIPNAILFERRGERVGYRLTGAITDAATVDSPVLNGSVDFLYGDLEEILVGQGLYRDEAHAMIETWKDSWFEEGCRLIYIVPRGFIDSVLPLTVDPAPGQIVRVFVGRLEIVTPETAMAVKTAVAHNDEATLDKYSRFLESILQTIRRSGFRQAPLRSALRRPVAPSRVASVTTPTSPP